MTRTKTLRTVLGWSQAKLGRHIGLSQAAVARIEAGAAESGPVAILLDQLASSMKPSDPGCLGVAAPAYPAEHPPEHQ